MMLMPICRHYSPKDLKAKDGCANCYKRIGIECLSHLESMNEYQTAKKFDALDKAMRMNKGVWLD